MAGRIHTEISALSEFESGLTIENSDNANQTQQSLEDKQCRGSNISITPDNSVPKLHQQAKTQPTHKVSKNSNKILSQLLSFASLKKSNSILLN